ncbi:unnamed protein product [Brassica oleracea]
MDMCHWLCQFSAFGRRKRSVFNFDNPMEFKQMARIQK